MTWQFQRSTAFRSRKKPNLETAWEMKSAAFAMEFWACSERSNAHVQSTSLWSGRRESSSSSAAIVGIFLDGRHPCVINQEAENFWHTALDIAISIQMIHLLIKMTNVISSSLSLHSYKSWIRQDQCPFRTLEWNRGLNTLLQTHAKYPYTLSALPPPFTSSPRVYMKNYSMHYINERIHRDPDNRRFYCFGQTANA
jgi:hypothetical protein